MSISGGQVVQRARVVALTGDATDMENKDAELRRGREVKADDGGGLLKFYNDAVEAAAKLKGIGKIIGLVPFAKAASLIAGSGSGPYARYEGKLADEVMREAKISFPTDALRRGELDAIGLPEEYGIPNLAPPLQDVPWWPLK